MKSFKLLGAIVLFAGLSAQATEKPYIISGLDDVLRQAENTGIFNAALKILEKDKTFAGMPELYQVISFDEESPQFTLVSGISSIFNQRIEAFLTSSGFPSNRRYLRNWLSEWSIQSFKIEKIKSLLSERPNRKFIVILDNSDASLQFAKEIGQRFPTQIVGVYLRVVVKKSAPSNTIDFYTAFDIATKEYELGRLSGNDVMKVGQAILNETDIDLLIPSYSQCPARYEPCGASSDGIKKICDEVTRHIQMLCKH